MPISTLEFTKLGPFDQVKFEFDPHINVLIGPNNCGKTTALLAIAETVIAPFNIPKKLYRGRARFSVEFDCPNRQSFKASGPFPISFSEKGYWRPPRWKELLETVKRLGYCVFIPALRLNTDYRSKGPTVAPRQRTSALIVSPSGEILGEAPEEVNRNENPVTLMRDERIVQEIIALDYRAYRENNAAVRSIVERIASLATRITEGFPMQFSGVAEDKIGLYPEFQTPDGKVPLNVLSQGTQSLLQWLATLITGYAKHFELAGDYAERPGILIIDEIDAHLHPSWQRRILPALTKEFPNLQVLCSTHSPLMLAGLQAGQIQLLSRSEQGRITVSRNNSDVYGWSADEILNFFLGVTHPTDLNTEQKVRRLNALRGKEKLSAAEAKELEALRGTVQQALQSGPIAANLDAMANGLKQAVAACSAEKNGKNNRSVRSSKRSTRKPAAR
ncbi:MAG: AAA family ATPase [Verrucomicrobia bacterium]|nr:AAA family ATPase [Verrucomicrobiota bacterium]